MDSHDLVPISQATAPQKSWMKFYTSQGLITSLHGWIKAHMKSSLALKDMFKSFIVNIIPIQITSKCFLEISFPPREENICYNIYI